MEEQNRLLAYQAIDENTKDTTVAKICKWVFEMEINGSDTIRPSDAYFMEKFGWTSGTTRVAISEAKKSGFITTTGRGGSRTFELNVQFLKGKMGEIVAKKPLRRTLNLKDLSVLPNNLPNKLPNKLPNNLPNNLPNKMGQNNRGENAPNSNSNSKSNSKSNSNEAAAGRWRVPGGQKEARIVYLRVNPSGRAWKSLKVYSTEEEVDRLESTNPEDNIEFKYWKSPNFVGDDNKAKLKYMKAKLIIPDVEEEEAEYKVINGRKCKKTTYKDAFGNECEGFVELNPTGLY